MVVYKEDQYVAEISLDKSIVRLVLLISLKKVLDH
jgi:hypothetical protein